MWKCKSCGHANNNSSKKCHGVNCKALREFEAIELPKVIIKEKEAKKVYDYCPKCKKDVFWIAKRYKGKGGYWGCLSCHRTAKLIGKPKPFPVEVENAAIR